MKCLEHSLRLVPRTLTAPCGYTCGSDFSSAIPPKFPSGRTAQQSSGRAGRHILLGARLHPLPWRAGGAGGGRLTGHAGALQRDTRTRSAGGAPARAPIGHLTRGRSPISALAFAADAAQLRWPRTSITSMPDLLRSLLGSAWRLTCSCLRVCIAVIHAQP